MPIKLSPDSILEVETTQNGEYAELYISAPAMSMSIRLTKEELEELHILIGLHLETMS
jgi:hypothetical protein